MAKIGRPGLSPEQKAELWKRWKGGQCASDIAIMWDTISYVLCMMLQIVILCVFPEIATWLPDHLMGITH